MKEYKELLRMMLVRMATVSKKKLDGKRILVHLYSDAEHAEEYKSLEGLLTYKYFRQLFGKVFHGLPYELPAIQDLPDIEPVHTQPIKQAEEHIRNKQILPLKYLEKTFGQGKNVLYEVLGEFCADISRILEGEEDPADVKFDWSRVSLKDFPKNFQDDDFEGALRRLQQQYPLS